MRKALCLFLSWSVFVLTFPVNVVASQAISGVERFSVAILDLQGTGISQLEAESLTDYMRSELQEKGDVVTVSKGRIEEVLEQLDFKETGCTSPECALEIGRLLETSRVVLGSITKEKQTYSLNCQMVNIETGRVQKTEIQVYEGDVDGLVLTLRHLVWDVTGLTPPPGRFPEEKPTVTRPLVKFTHENWDVPQTVIVYGVDDKIDDGDQDYTVLTDAVISQDSNYNALAPPTVSIVNMDDDESGITVFPTGGLVTSEAGDLDSFSVVLTSEPTAQVLLVLSSSDSMEGKVSRSSLIFDGDNWEILRNVGVTGLDDDIDDGDEDYAVWIDPAVSTDTTYDGFTVDTVDVINIDDDTAGVRIHPAGGLLTTEAGGTATVEVTLTSQPEADVQVPLSSSDTTEGTVTPERLTFTSDNWNSAQIVTVRGVRDEDDSDQSYRMVLDTLISSDPNYSGLDPDDVSLENMDYRPGVIRYPAQGLTVSEAGGDTSFWLGLTSQPAEEITIPIVSSDTTEGKVSPASVTFSLDDWNTPKTVTVTGADDNVVDGHQGYTIVVGAAISADQDYDDMTPEDVSVTTLDDDEVGITIDVEEDLITREQGDTLSFAVALSSEPFADVVFTLVSSDTTEGRVSPSSLTFQPGNWDSLRTILVTGINDDVDDGDVAYGIILADEVSSYDPGYGALEAFVAEALNVDDDTSGITVTPAGALTTSEAERSDTFLVALTSEPVLDVIVQLTVSDSTEGWVSPDRLVFGSDNWSDPQTVTVTGLNDDVDDGDQRYSVAVDAANSADQGYSTLDPSYVSVSNVDDDETGITITADEGLKTTEVSGMERFAVVLNSEPTADVELSLNSSDLLEGIVSPSVLTFSGRNWDLPQSVFITGVNDDEDDGDQTYSIEISAAVSEDPGYHGSDVDDIPVTNMDDDGPGIVLFPTTGLTTIESGSTATFTLVLSEEPSAEVEISMTSSDSSEGAVSPFSVVFTPENWNTPQRVTVTGVDDTLDDGDKTFAIDLGSPVSDDPEYNGLRPENIGVMNKDDDGPGIIVYPTGEMVTQEDGNDIRLTVMLTSEPTAQVTLSLGSSDETEGLVKPASLTFRSRTAFRMSNWNIRQTVTLMGVDDDVDDGDKMYAVLIDAAVSQDSAYNGLDPEDIWVVNRDEDEAGLILGSTDGLVTTEAGGEAIFTAALASQPVADVSLAFRSSDLTEGTVLPSTLTFTQANWYSAQSVTVVGVDDDVDDTNQDYDVTIDSVVSQDPIYDGMSVGDVSVTNVDDDEAGIRVVADHELTTSELGEAETFAVELTSEPQSDVTVSLTSSDEAEGTVSPSSITFSAEDWNTSQPVRLTGVDDYVDDGDKTYTITIGIESAADSNYYGLDTMSILASNLDDDTRGIQIAPTEGLTTTEAGSTATFMVNLTSQPVDDVTLSLTSSDTLEGTVSPSSITFTPQNWSISHRVTVSGVDDTLFSDDRSYKIITGSAVSNDSLYHGLDPMDVSMRNKNDDGPAIIVYPTAPLATTETEDSVTFTAVLTSEPAGDVVLPFSSSDDSEGTVSPSELTFTKDNWSISQTITVTGVDDDMDDGDQVYTIITQQAISDDSSYAGIDPDDVLLTNKDDDEHGIVINPTSGFITTESGSTASFAVALTSEPTADVSFFLKSMKETEGSVEPSLIVFSPGNWRSPQSVSITGMDDSVEDGDQVYSVSIDAAESADPNYQGMDPDDPLVANLDDDEAGIILDPLTDIVTSEFGIRDTVTVVLTSQPTSDVGFSLTSSDESEGRVHPASLLFSAANWYDPQIVTVMGVNDDVDDGDQFYVIKVDSIISNDSNYSSINLMSIPASNIDDDTAGILVEWVDEMMTTESGGADTFAVVLTSEPIADVNLSFYASDDTEGTLRPPVLPEDLRKILARERVSGNLLTDALWWIAGHFEIVLVAVVMGGSIAAITLPGGKEEPTIEVPPVFPKVPD